MYDNGKEFKVFDLFIELRKELVESQKIRSQIIGFKITFVSAAAAFIGVLQASFSPYTLCVPAFAAIFFDFLINSYSFSIKRLGYYIRYYLEPSLHEVYRWPEKAGYKTDQEFVLWERFLTAYNTSQRLAFIGNIGITSVVSLIAVIGLWNVMYNWYVYTLLLIFLILDIIGFAGPNRFNKDVEKRREIGGGDEKKKTAE